MMQEQELIGAASNMVVGRTNVFLVNLSPNFIHNHFHLYRNDLISCKP
jgi:hypothetical protein